MRVISKSIWKDSWRNITLKKNTFHLTILWGCIGMNATHIYILFNSEKNQTMTFSYTRFLVNKINVEKFLKIMKKSLFNYSFYSHPEIWKFQGVT
jgi:hypothetical protein